MDLSNYSGQATAGRSSDRARWRLPAMVLVVIGLLAIVYAPVFADFVTAWLSYEEYNYALLVPLISLFLVWRRWPKLRAEPLRPEALGGALFAAGLLMLVVGTAIGVHVAQGLSFIPTLLGLIWFLWGRGPARTLLFPVAYLACGLGLYRGLASSLGFAMQGVTARYAAVVAGWLGAQPHRDGLVLSVGHMQFVVAQTCSGLSSLLALLALGWLIVGEGPGSLRYKILLCLAIAPLALTANIVRVALVLVIARDISEAIAQGFVHGLFSVSIFVFAVMLLLIVREILLWLERSASHASLRPS